MPALCAWRLRDEVDQRVGFVTIPTLALTAFALVFAALLFSMFEPGAHDAEAKAET